MTLKSAQLSIQVNRNTIRLHIRKLIASGQIEHHGDGRSTWYSPVVWPACYKPGEPSFIRWCLQGAHLLHDFINQYADSTRLQRVTRFLEWNLRGAERQGLLEAAKHDRMQCGNRRLLPEAATIICEKSARRHLSAIGDLHQPEIALGRSGP